MIRARYDQKNSTMASITTILAMIGYTAAQFVAGASILNVLTGWDLGRVLCPCGRGHRVLCLDGRPARRDVYRHRADGAAAARRGRFWRCRWSARMLHKNGMSLAADLPASFFDLGAWGWPTIARTGPVHGHVVFHEHGQLHPLHRGQGRQDRPHRHDLCGRARAHHRRGEYLPRYGRQS